jgi:Ca2+-transporting ATPase
LLVVLLLVAAGVSLALEDVLDAVAIGVVVMVNAAIGFFTELRATRSMEGLRKLTTTFTRVRRAAETTRIPSGELVCGDRVVLEAGDLVPADLRIVLAHSLQADESVLTGESSPVQKRQEPVAADAVLADRLSMLYRGSRITAGGGEGVVCATGMSSELGRISHLVSEAADQATPLERKLDRLGYRLVCVTLGMTLILGVIGVLKGQPAMLMIQTCVALAVAAIPEGLPVVATIALSRGLWRMARENVVISRLSAVETLGATGVICADKTGTLTENRLTLSVAWPVGEQQALELMKKAGGGGRANGGLGDLLLTGLLCNNAAIHEEGGESVGDPLEVALLEGAVASGIELAGVLAEWERMDEVPFDAAARRMAVVHRRSDGECRVSAKGAAEAILPLCPELQPAERELWQECNEQLARRGLRVIALAGAMSRQAPADPFHGLIFFGLVGLIDPARPRVSDAVGECLSAGIRVTMITGDQPATAEAIARQIGIPAELVVTGGELAKMDIESSRARALLDRVDVVARATPEQKLRLVRRLQEAGHVVAMTGDGVNDAPALKQADIGIAMGQRGTDVAREASAMVLLDDAFPSIVVAVRQGRLIFNNIRMFVAYLISCNFSEILVVWFAMLLTGHLPILPLQILFLNLVTDVFPALALGVSPPQEDLMKQRPRPRGEPILRNRDWWRAGWHGMVIAVATLGAFLWAKHHLGFSEEEAVTTSFLTLALAQLLHVFNMAGPGMPYFRSGVVRNPWVWGAIALCLLLLFGCVAVPVFAEVLSLHQPGIEEILAICLFSLMPVACELVVRMLRSLARPVFGKDSRQPE